GQRVLGAGDAGVHQDAVTAELHGNGRVRGGADAGVDDDRYPDRFLDDLDVVWVANAEAAADGRPQRHDGGAAKILQLLAHDRVVAGVGEDRETLLDEDFGRLEELLIVGKEGLLVAKDLQLDEVGHPGFPGQKAGPDRVVGRVAAGGVREEGIFFQVDMV